MPARQGPAVRVAGLTRYYGRHPAIRDLTFTIERGAIVGFLGLNGAGKSTTLRILAGVLLPTAGRIEVGGLDPRDRPREVRRQIGYLPEVPPLYPEMAVGAYLTFAARLRGMSAREAAPAVREAEARTGLAEVHGERIQHLSHGFRQRVGLAQAIVHRPSLLVLDEPSKGLDPAQIVEMRRLILGLRGDHTVLVASHILPEISRLCDRVLAIHRGRIVADGSEETIARRAQAVETIEVELAGSSDAVLEALARVPGASVVWATAGDQRVRLRIAAPPGSQPRLATALVDHGVDIYRIDAAAALETMFVDLAAGRAA